MVVRSKLFVKETVEELKKVNWSTKDQLITSTKVVIIGSIIMAVYLGVVDAAFSAVLNWFLKMRI
ncbi:preprotein translocase subunit SecE [bacterium]|nr:preprotein translocase subunit SecE [bacterium]